MTAHEGDENLTEEAQREFERYCVQFPDSPTGQEHPRLLPRGSYWIALIGCSLQDGVGGIGDTVPEALAAFDAQYLHTRRPHE